MTEDQIQAEFWKRAWNEFPELTHHMWAIPNGLPLSAPTAARAKATGLLEGVWDIHIFFRNRFYILETKRPGENLTVDRIDPRTHRKHFGQKEWGERMVSHGATAFVYRTVEEGLDIIRNILITS